MPTLKSVIGVIGTLVAILYCGRLLYYFLDLTGSVQEAETNGLGPTLLGLGAVGLLFCIVAHREDRPDVRRTAFARIGRSRWPGRVDGRRRGRVRRRCGGCPLYGAAIRGSRLWLPGCASRT